MISSQRLQILEKQKEQILSQIKELEDWRNSCYEDIKKQNSLARRKQLNTEIDGYTKEIDELLDKLEKIQEKIDKLNSSSSTIKDGNLAASSLNNHLNNPNNQQELNINKSLCYLDFQQALETFQTIQYQFNKDGDVALFFIEESLIKRGDLCLQRLRDDLKSNINSSYRKNFRYCPVTYTSNNLEGVVQEIAKYFDVQLNLIVNQLSLLLVIKKKEIYLLLFYVAVFIITSSFLIVLKNYSKSLIFITNINKRNKSEKILHRMN